MIKRERVNRPRRSWIAAASAMFALSASLGALAGIGDRTIDGSDNNLDHPSWGQADTTLLRAAAPDYADGVSAMAGQDRPNPRTISNNIFVQNTMLDGVFIPSPRGLTDFVWTWGQFLSHDTNLTPADTGEWAFIHIPAGDFWFDPKGTGDFVFPFRRSIFDTSTGTDPENPREHLNVLTSWIDASTVYGSDEDRAAWLRTFEGGRLKSTPHPTGDLLPFNDGTQENTFGNTTDFFVGGEKRTNETLPLIVMHTLFMREHNRLADEIAAANPTWTDEEIYQRARKIVGAQIQAITYNEFLPTFLGDTAIPPYTGYDPTVNGSLLTEFTAAAFRVGHTMVGSIVLRLDENGDTIPEGNLNVFESFFSPERIVEEGGVDPLLRGLAAGQQQKVDSKVVDDLRNFLFNSPGGGEPAALDLVAINIHRGRDHGLPDYNTVRQAYGLPARTSFNQISSDPEVVSALESTYDSVDNIDLWVGLLCEDQVPGASAGETLRAMWIEQFTRLRDGDRFWHQRDPALKELLPWLESRTLADVVIDNTSIQDGEIQPNVFQLPCPPDLNGDGQVNGADIALLLANWGSTGESPMDLDGDGVIGSGDLAFLLTAWGDCF